MPQPKRKDLHFKDDPFSMDIFFHVKSHRQKWQHIVNNPSAVHIFRNETTPTSCLDLKGKRRFSQDLKWISLLSFIEKSPSPSDTSKLGRKRTTATARDLPPRKVKRETESSINMDESLSETVPSSPVQYSSALGRSKSSTVQDSNSFKKSGPDQIRPFTSKDSSTSSPLSVENSPVINKSVSNNVKHEPLSFCHFTECLNVTHPTSQHSPFCSVYCRSSMENIEHGLIKPRKSNQLIRSAVETLCKDGVISHPRSISNFTKTLQQKGICSVNEAVDMIRQHLKV
ncbi:hypothetical protein P9112_011396 [Eukaryota sp. TZLM1-RC]